MAQIDLSKQTTEWIKRAIIANSEEYERLLTPMNEEEEQQAIEEVDRLASWLEELMQELDRRQKKETDRTMGNFVLESAVGCSLALFPEDSVIGYPIEDKDIAEIIQKYFYDIGQKFTVDDLVTAIQLFDNYKKTGLDLNLMANGQWLIRGAKNARLIYYHPDPDACPSCGSDNFDAVFSPADPEEIDRLQCDDCGFTWENGPIELALEDTGVLLIARLPDDGGPQGIETR